MAMYIAFQQKLSGNTQLVADPLQLILLETMQDNSLNMVGTIIILIARPMQ